MFCGFQEILICCSANSKWPPFRLPQPPACANVVPSGDRNRLENHSGPGPTLQSCSRSGRALDGLGPAASNLFAGLRRRLAFNVRVHRSPFGVWRASRYIGSSATALMLDRARQTPNVERFKIGLSVLGAFCLIQPVDFWQGGRTVTGSAARTGRYSLMTCVLYLWLETKKNTK